ncbi:class I SAM-dependent methyltransferase [Candidatus Uhrbacteria bacterium]|nr:class I SAM-dependent methyltransferase [Candidatus Uhrbacteria bacterium]
MLSALYETAGGTRLLDPEFILAQLDVEVDQHIGEFGCGGGGHFTFPLARRVGRGGMVYAVDVVPDVLESLRRRARVENLPQIQVIHSNLEVIGAAAIPEESIDRVLCVNILFQNIHHDHIFKEAQRLLKVSGKLLVVDWRQETGPVGPPLARRVNLEQLKAVASTIGLHFESEFSASVWHFGALFSRQ